MPSFFDLPRELRDLIYTEVILWERPRPILGHPQWLSFRFRRVNHAQSSVTGEYGCAYALDTTPTTCANLLCCNRQVNAEMQQVLALIRKQDGRGDGQMLAAGLDCIAEDESFHYFTWLKVPLASTLRITMPQTLHPWLPHWLSSTRLFTRRIHTTKLDTLWINIRIAGDRSRKFYRNSAQADRTSWAVCATLKRLLDHGPDLSPSTNRNRNSNSSPPPPSPSPIALPPSRHIPSTSPLKMQIKTLVLNVIPPPHLPPDSFLPLDTQNNEVRNGLVHPQTVARELLDVWAKIWLASEYKGIYYQDLLEGIGDVKVCVEGRAIGSRPLGRELRRGRRGFGGNVRVRRAERRRRAGDYDDDEWEEVPYRTLFCMFVVFAVFYYWLVADVI